MPTDYLIDCRYDQTSDKLHLLTGDHCGTVNILQLGHDLIPEAKLVGGHKSTIRSIDWDSQMLLTGGEDSRLCKWTLSLSDVPPTANRGAIRTSVERDVGGIQKARNSCRPY
jgi:hypothetical protein